MKFEYLIERIRKDSKITDEELFEILRDAIEKNTCEKEVFKMLYTKAYGEHLIEDLAKEWVSNMTVPVDGEKTTGERWTMEETTSVGTSMQIDWNKMSKCEWYVAMNMAYSDKFYVARTFDLAEETEFYAMMAKADWIDDSDVKNKTLLSYYFFYIL